MKNAFLGLALCFSVTVSAATYDVLMLNKGKTGEAMVFEPAFLKIKKGDSVKFIPKDKGHSVESFKGGAPAGAADWKGGLNREITIKFEKEGVHVYKCLPHFAMGMVGAVQVGAATNLAQVKGLKMSGKAGLNYAKILAQVK